jgi:integrase/recombinase XerD
LGIATCSRPSLAVEPQQVVPGQTECADGWHGSTVGDDVQQIVEEWAGFLSKELLWGPDDPLFPASRVEVGPDRAFHAAGLDRRHWTTADPIRQIFRRAFAGAGLPYFPPHRLRDTLATLGERLCQTPEEFKAWSQNLGHSGVLTTFTSYGEVASIRQATIIRALGQARGTNAEVVDQLSKALEVLRRNA